MWRAFGKKQPPAPLPGQRLRSTVELPSQPSKHRQPGGRRRSLCCRSIQIVSDDFNRPGHYNDSIFRTSSTWHFLAEMGWGSMRCRNYQIGVVGPGFHAAHIGSGLKVGDEGTSPGGCLNSRIFPTTSFNPEIK
jgi:hypothetical protein